MTAPRRVYQCPGCWSSGLFHVPAANGSLECDCGERLTRIDLRDSEAEESARAAVMFELLAKVKAEDYRMVEWWAMDGKTFSLYQVISRNAVLDLMRS